MRGQRLNLVLMVALLVSLGANWYMRQTALYPNVEFAPNMARGPAFLPYEPNPSFPDGMTLHPPVVGTIARGTTPLGYGPSAVDAMRAGNELTNPFTANDRSALERGKLTFERYCVPCHGATGVGDGPVVERGFRRPPTLLRPFTRQMKDGQMFHLVTFGRGAMPPHGPQIPVNDRWKALLHVRSLQAAAGGATPAAAGTAGAR